MIPAYKRSTSGSHQDVGSQVTSTIRPGLPTCRNASARKTRHESTRCLKRRRPASSLTSFESSSCLAEPQGLLGRSQWEADLSVLNVVVSRDVGTDRLDERNLADSSHSICQFRKWFTARRKWICCEKPRRCTRFTKRLTPLILPARRRENIRPFLDGDTVRPAGWFP